VRHISWRWIEAVSGNKNRSATRALTKKKEEDPMKKRSVVMVSLMLFSIIVAAQVARATEPLVVNIPFEFVAGTATFPAGEYIVESMGTGPLVILTQRTDRSVAAIVPTIPAGGGDVRWDTKLVFNRYGEHYFLSQIWTAGYREGKQLFKSDREKEIAKSARFETQGQVTLVARLFSAKP